MFCPNCGERLDEKQNTCVNCGKPASDVSPAPIITAPSHTKINAVYVLIGLLLITVLGFIVWVVFSRDTGGNTEAAAYSRDNTPDTSLEAERAELERARMELETERARLEAEAEAARIIREAEAEAERIRIESERARIEAEQEAERVRIEEENANRENDIDGIRFVINDYASAVSDLNFNRAVVYAAPDHTLPLSLVDLLPVNANVIGFLGQAIPPDTVTYSLIIQEDNITISDDDTAVVIAEEIITIRIPLAGEFSYESTKRIFLRYWYNGYWLISSITSM